MKYSRFPSFDKFLFLLLGLFVFTSSNAQIPQRNSIEIGHTFYRFPNWQSRYANEYNIGSLYYSRKVTIGNTPVRWSVDANLLAWRSIKDNHTIGEIIERKLFLSNVSIGTSLLKRNKKYDLYFNMGVVLRAGYEEELVRFGRDSRTKKTLWLPGINFSMDYTYHLSKNLVFHPFAGLNLFAERTYYFGYSGVNVGWAFGKK